MTSDFIPNSYQTPNAYVDKFMGYLTPEEWMVLSYFVRRIFGFQKRQDHIALSQVMDGITTKDGEPLDLGTGLGASAARNAIRALIIFNLIIEVEPNNPHKNTGPLYALQLNSELVNVQAMVERKAAKAQRHSDRMNKAREARVSIRPPSNEQNPSYPIEPPPSYPIEPPPLLSNKRHNNQRKQVEKQIPPNQIMFGALARLCRVDPKLKAGQIGRTVKSLMAAEYTACDLEHFGAWWSENDFRGRRGEPPTLGQVLEKIQQAKQAIPTAPQTPQKVMVQLPGGQIVEATA